MPVIDIEIGQHWFEGHFPGRPILPGVAQLALALQALNTDRDDPVTLSGIGFARMRHAVLPGAPLQMTWGEPAGDAVRFTLSQAGTPMTQAEFHLGPTRAAPPPARVPPTADRGDAPVAALLPHRPPMRFVDSVVAEATEGISCIARIPGRCAMVADGSAPALAAIEAAAQAAAVWEAVRRRREGGSAAPRLGYLVGLRDVTCFAQRIEADRPFLATIRLDAATLALTHYAVRIDVDETPVLTGTLATFLTGETLPY